MRRRRPGTSAAVTRIALVAIYLAGMAAGVVAMDSKDGAETASIIVLVVSLLLGAGTGDYRLATLSLLAVPFAIPFGFPEDTEADPLLPTWLGAMYLAAWSAAAIFIAAFLREIAISRLQRRGSPRDSSGA
jgi:hypothetical protein